MKAKMKRSEASVAVAKWYLITNIDLATITLGPFDDRDEAQMEAERCMKVGVWLDNRRLYPPHAIVFIDMMQRSFDGD